MTPEKVLLVDSDTLTKWIFPKEGDEEDVVIRFEDIPEDITVCVGFPAVADMYFHARWRRDRRFSEGKAEEAARSYDEAVHVLNIWFGEHLFVLHAVDENLSRLWLDIVNSDPVDERANREHAWIVAMAQYLRGNRRMVQIACEEPGVYRSFARRGYLDDIGIHGIE